MTLDKAIEVLDNIIAGTEMFEDEEDPQAIKLGIEALSRIAAWRNDNDEDLLWDLPGETNE